MAKKKAAARAPELFKCPHRRLPVDCVTGDTWVNPVGVGVREVHWFNGEGWVQLVKNGEPLKGRARVIPADMLVTHGPDYRPSNSTRAAPNPFA